MSCRTQGCALVLEGNLGSWLLSSLQWEKADERWETQPSSQEFEVSTSCIAFSAVISRERELVLGRSECLGQGLLLPPFCCAGRRLWPE